MAKVRTICIDTLTQIQENEYMTDKSKPGFDKWKDYSINLWEFMLALQNMGFELVLVLGSPGVGKSTGMRNLPSKTNIWFNVDNKNPVWIGGKQEYGKKSAPIFPYHMIPRNYEDIINHLNEGFQNGIFEEERYAILTGHIENYKEGHETKSRLKTLGNLTNKMQLEGKLETVFYAKVEREGAEMRYLLETQNDGLNTARSPQGAFEPKIDNDYSVIINKLLEY